MPHSCLGRQISHYVVNVRKSWYNGNGTKAALDTYNAKNAATANSIASENLQKPAIKREIGLALEAAGLSNAYISELLREATVAGLGVKATNSDALRGLDMMLKLKGAYPTTTQKSAHIRIDMRQEVSNKNYSELKAELEKKMIETSRLLHDLNNNTPYTLS